MSDFIAALNDEIADLERQLSQSPIYVKLRRAQELRDAYLVSAPTKGMRAPEAPRPVSQFASGNSAAILDAVKAHLRGKSLPTKTRDLMGVLAERGIEVGGSVPQNSVSSMLSKSPDIVSHGRAGWTLVETEKAGDDTPEKDASPASISTSAPVELGEEVAHYNIAANEDDDLL